MTEVSHSGNKEVYTLKNWLNYSDINSSSSSFLHAKTTFFLCSMTLGDIF